MRRIERFDARAHSRGFTLIELLVAIAMLRSDPALQFLLDRLSAESGPVAGDALAGLAFYARDETVLARVEQIIKERGDETLQAVFAREFGRR